ncbi:MAG: ribonuclease M5 [Firmicutes bacterium]|nr:ribonuclease M5 [Bacillota bacterium]
MEKLRLLETVVVEGRDDEAAVLRAVDAAVISTHGWGLPEGNVERIRAAYERTGIIILTDPDFAGENIRRRLSEQFPDAKHAYLARPEASKRQGERVVDIGVENAAPEAIQAALLAARAQVQTAPCAETVTQADLIALGLAGGSGSTQLREALGKELGIGSCNAKAFARRLAAFGIPREEFLAAWRRISQENR